MTKPLRKRHIQLWSALLVLLPAGIILSWLAIPDQSPVKLLQSQVAELLPVIIRSADRKDYSVNIRSNKENTKWQLEWKNKTALTVPSAVIYKTAGTNDDISNSELIGRIEATGDYVFPLRDDSSGYRKLHLILYDFIHEQKIDSINFLP